MPDPALLQVLVDQGIAAREFNELMRESMETYERDNLAMRTTLENQQTLLETQQSALAAVQSVSIKTAKLLRPRGPGEFEWRLRFRWQQRA